MDKQRIDELCGLLNDALGEVTPYKLAVEDPAQILPIDKNAHFMPKRIYDQMVQNIQRDKNLSSLPFCWKRADGRFVAISGNHRVETAVKAGVEYILLLYTDMALSQSQLRAIQLSHNSLVGQDDPQKLRELWEEITDLSEKVYSGLDADALMAVEQVNLVRFQEAELRFEEVRLLFIQPELQKMDAILKRLGTVTRNRYAVAYKDFDRFFDRLLKYKEAQGMLNSSTAVAAMLDICETWLNEHEAAEREAQAKAKLQKETA